MGSQQQSYSNTPQNYSLIPIFSEFFELYDSDNHPFFQSCEGNFSTTIEANNYHQAGNICGDQYDHDHVIIEEIHQQMVDLEKVKQCSSESTDSTSNKAASRRINAKPRMKWTQDLHERFVECVNRLGGAEKARPKAILKLMSSNVLTIFHVKSHLQKYRTSKHMAEYSKEKSENITTLDGTFQLDMNSTGILNIKEALQHVNKRLHEQLEIQHNLQMLIEEQSKQLKMMLEQQEKTNKSLFIKSLIQNSDSPLTLPKIPCDSFDDDHGSSMEGSRSSRSQSNV